MLIVVGDNVISVDRIVAVQFRADPPDTSGAILATVFLHGGINLELVGDDVSKFAFFLRHSPFVTNVNMMWEDRELMDAALLSAQREKRERRATDRRPDNAAGLHILQSLVKDAESTGAPFSPTPRATPAQNDEGRNPWAEEIDYSDEGASLIAFTQRGARPSTGGGEA